MRVAAFVVLSLPTMVRADEGTSLLSDEPLLHLDPIVQPQRIGLPETIDVAEQTTIALGKRTWVELQGLRYTNSSFTPERAWTASLRLAHDVGPFTIIAQATLGGVESRYERGAYYDVALTIGKTRKLSRWMTAWIALSVGRRTWLGKEPPPGEIKEADAVMLSIGTTFK